MRRALLITVGVVLALCGVLAFVGEPAGWPPVEPLPQQGEAALVVGGSAPPSHAPHALARLVREPQNTWSSMAFVIGGAWLAAVAIGGLARGLGLALIAVGGGSFLYHASASRVLRHFDVAAMYWVFLMTVLLCLAAVMPRGRAHLERNAVRYFFAALLLAAGWAAARNVAIGGMKPFSLRLALAVTAATLIGSLAVVARRRESVPAALQLLGIVTLLGAALACQTADQPGGRFFRPEAVIQAHAVWHVLAATTVVWAGRFLDREPTVHLPESPP